MFGDEERTRRDACSVQQTDAADALGIAHMRKFCVAVPRELAVIMHAMWTDGTVYVGDPSAGARELRTRVLAKQRKLLGAHA